MLLLYQYLHVFNTGLPAYVSTRLLYIFILKFINNQLFISRITSLLVLLAASEPPVQATVFKEAQHRRRADIQFAVANAAGVRQLRHLGSLHPAKLVRYDVTSRMREELGGNGLRHDALRGRRDHGPYTGDFFWQ